uniref:hypothetical protein n=1 Tax=Escherichia coli TaxID=562 RepID=UPI0038B2E3A2
LIAVCYMCLSSPCDCDLFSYWYFCCTCVLPVFLCHFFFQAEAGIRDFGLSGGFGEVYKGQSLSPGNAGHSGVLPVSMLFLLIFQPANSLKIYITV